MPATAGLPRPVQRFRVVLSPEDAELLDERARAVGLIPSALARALILSALRGTEPAVPVVSGAPT